jgi:serine protease Do
VADDLIKDGKVDHGVLGVESQEVDHNLAQIMGIPNTHGAIVTHTTDGSPAAQSGLQRYDVVVKVNDNEVDSPEKLSYLVAMADPGTAVNLTVLRDGKPKVLKVVLGDYSKLYPEAADTTTKTPPANTAMPMTPVVNHGELLTGVSLLPLTPDLRESEGLPDDVNGLIVLEIDPHSPYYNLFRAKTVLMEVNKKPVATLDDLKAQLKLGELNMFYIYAPATSTRVYDPQTGRPSTQPIDARTELVTEAVQKSS